MAGVVRRHYQVFTESDSSNDGVGQAKTLPLALPLRPQCFVRMRRLDAFSASCRNFLTQAAAPPASSISG